MEKFASVIIPTYNERENIGRLLKIIFTVLPHSHVIIVDDSNKTESEKLQKTVKNNFNHVTIIARQKKLGRGSAILTGLKEALKDKKTAYFFEMDADLAHDPLEFPKFLSRIKSADLVIGSRYLEKSNIKKWPLRRLIMSRCINTFLSLWLGLNITDYTDGYRLYTRRAVTFLLEQRLKETGFIALSEIAYKLKRRGFTIAEVPITFTDRIYGKSSAGLSEHINAFLGMIRIKFS